MAFLHSPNTKGIVEYITSHFAVAFPLLPLPKDFRALCPSFEPAVAKEAAKYYELPELPQVIFYVMLLNKAERLGVVQGRALRSLESALVELHWSTFESWVWLYSDQIFKARFCPMAGSRRVRELVNEERARRRSGILYRESDQYTCFPLLLCRSLLFTTLGRWPITRSSRPPHPLPEDFHALCPRFSLSKAEGAATDFELREIVQATLYTILLNEAVELGVVHDFSAEGLKSALVGLRWLTFESLVEIKLQVLSDKLKR
ncbi:hypothetical protein Cgig2_013677 [Carnegiea gigantea]|uniref:Uncharacterized protein n=1 Tax=Carnegiea gigantea TaxID=171969 RepID=A0A9Q1KDH4_9CARY|nr:hypothetical protein Cgig2_013677 [Carnegiea gigantea]